MDLKSQKASENARKRWEISDRNATAMRPHSNRNANKEKERKENKKEEVEEEKKSSPPPVFPPEPPPELIPGVEVLTIPQARERYDRQNQAAKEALCIKHRLDGFKALESLQNQFDRHLAATGVQRKTDEDYSRHFANWLNKLPPDEINPKSRTDHPTNLPVIQSEITDPDELAFKLRYSQQR